MDSTPTSEILLQHGRFVQALAHALLRDPHAADDVVQETWIQWLRRGGDAVAAPRGWLRSAVRHLAANRSRAEGRRARHEALGAASEPARSPADEVERAELLHRVVDAVFALEEPYRETILARYFRSLSAGELASAGGEPPATVRSRERRALELLRAKLDRDCGGRSTWAALLLRLSGAPAGVPTSAVLVACSVVGLALIVSALVWRAIAVDERGRAEDPRVALASGLTAPTPISEAIAPRSPESSREHAAVSPVSVSTADDRDEDDDSALVGLTLDTSGTPLAGVDLHFGRSGKALASTRSDERGRFRVEGLASFNTLDAELPGHRLLHATNPERDPLEPYAPMRVTLAPAGTLVLNVHDRAGRPIEGLVVSAIPRPEELVDGAGAETLVRQAVEVKAETDAAGRALLEGLWSGVRLALTLGHVDLVQVGAFPPHGIDLEEDGGSHEVRIDRALDGRLLLDHPAGAPIVVRAGGTLELAATWGVPQVLRGIVVDGEGLPAPGCKVGAEDEGYERYEDGHHLALERTDPEGRFELAFRPAALRGPVRVFARRDGPRQRVTAFEGTSWSIAPAEWEAERRLAAGELEYSEPVALVLGPAEEVLFFGTVKTEDGNPLDWSMHRLTLLDHESAAPASGVTHVQSRSGAFAVTTGVRPRLYDLVITANAPLARSRELGAPVFSCFAGEPAGVERAPFVLAKSAPVNLRIRGEALGLVHLVRFFPRQARSFPRRLPPAPWTLQSPAPWLAPDSLADGARAGGDGTWLVVQDRANGDDELALPLGDPGWYQLRVESRGRAPLATEVVYLKPGEHVLVVEAPKVGALHGRMLADGTREFLGLQLADENGQPLARVQPVRASGEFRLEELACGRCRLRCGGLDELEAGRFRHELALEVLPGENPALEIEL